MRNIVLAATFVALAATACSEGGAPRGRGDGEGGAPPSSVSVAGGGGRGGSWPTPNGNGHQGVTTYASMTLDGGAYPHHCSAPSFFDNEELDSCAQSECCEELEKCAWGFPDPDDLGPCRDDSGALDESTVHGAALAACMTENCPQTFYEWCSSDIGYVEPTPELIAHAACLSDNCCDAIDVCTADGTDVDGCLDCLNGQAVDFARCEGVEACSIEACGQPVVWVPVCESGVYFPGLEAGTCASLSCCAEFQDCAGDGSSEDLEACYACLLGEDPTAVCDAASQCMGASCGTEICDSGILAATLGQAACLGDACCVPFTECAGDGSPEQIQLCLDCLMDASPGPLCVDALACEEVGCPT